MCAAAAATFGTCLAAAQTPPGPTALTFQAALDLALAENLYIAAARGERAVREGAVVTAGQHLNPDVAFETTRDTPHQALSLEVPIEIGGQRGRRLDVANEELALADAGVQAEISRLRAQVRRRFYALVAADRRLEIAADLVAIATRFRDTTRARFEAGAAPRLDLMQAELGVTQADADRDLAVSERAAAQAELNGVLNQAPEWPVQALGAMSDRARTPPFPQALALARTSNGDLTLLDRTIAVEQRRTSLLRVERVPTPIFSIGGVFDAPGEFGAGYRAGVTIGLPLFSRNQGQIASSIANATRLQGERQATLRTLDNGVYAALARIDAQRRRVAAYDTGLVPMAAELESLTEESYQAGRSPLVGVLDAQRNLRDLHLESLQAALDLQLALADLEEILGAPLE